MGKKKILITCLIAFLIVLVACIGISKYIHAYKLAHPMFGVSNFDNVIEIVANNTNKKYDLGGHLKTGKN